MGIFDVFDRISSGSTAAGGKIEYVIAGLGNPGLEYEGTRHNAGFFTIDALAEQAGVKIDRLRFKGKTAEATIGGKRYREKIGIRIEDDLLITKSGFVNISRNIPREIADIEKLMRG